MPTLEDFQIPLTSAGSGKLEDNWLFTSIKHRKGTLTNPDTPTHVSIFVPTSNEAILFILLVSLPNLNSEKISKIVTETL